MKHIDVDPGSYRRAQQHLERSTAEADTALSRFVAELESHGRPWGDDELGSLIGLSYQGILAKAMACFASNLDAIDAYAERLGFAASEYERTDAESAERLRRLPDASL